MTDEQKPTIRDPRGPANMLAGAAAGANTGAAAGSGVASGPNAYAGTPVPKPPVFTPMASSNGGSRPPVVPSSVTTGGLAGAADDADDGRVLERGLARLDSLTVRPRTSSRVLCVVFGVLLLALAAGVWWLGVRTETGQSYDEIVVTGFQGALPDWLAAMLDPFVRQNIHTNLPIPINMTVILSLLIGVIALVVMAVRRRWWLIGQSVAIAALSYAASWLKDVLPRPFLINTDTPHENSAPSGHTILAATAAAVLLIAVPRVWRAACALIAAAYMMVIGLSVIAGGWHRPTDVIMSILLVGGIALLVLACTRTSGMDDPGRRVSSVSVQIVGSVMITAGLLACAYAAYIIWQIEPGLEMSAQWSQGGSHLSTVIGVTGVALLVGGLMLAMRQLTAAPLSRIGLIGAPPAPPKQ